MKDTFRQVLVVLAVIATLTVNILANALPFNGLTTAEISDRFHVYFVPAGYVFAIWGLIYVGLIAYAVFQALPAQRENPRLRRTGYPIVVGCLANCVWLFLWHYEQFGLTLIAMFGLLAMLILTYLNLEIGRTPVPTAETWAARVPISIYLGWITVATIANVTDVLYYWNWNGFGISARDWTLVMFVAVIVIAGWISITRRDIAYNLVIVWALAGIAVKQSAAKSLVLGSLATAAVVLAVLAYGIYKERQKGLLVAKTPVPAAVPAVPAPSRVRSAARRRKSAGKDGSRHTGSRPR
jgi:benzodiazapine receptor